MPPALSRDIWLSPSYFEEEEIVTHPRYRWNSWERGEQPFVILQWTRSGAGAYEDKRGRWPVPPNHAFISIVPERSTYYYPPEARDPWIFTWASFYGTLAGDFFRKFRDEFGPVVPLSMQGAAAAAFRRLLTMAGHADRTQVSLQCYTFILEWWREASQPTDDPEAGLARALRFCRDHFREPLSVKQIAHEAGMSREHFSRAFAQRTQETPAAFLRRLRVEEAARLLRETRLPLREIAMRSGFYSPRHLMRTFQREHQLTPSTYRQRNKA